MVNMVLQQVNQPELDVLLGKGERETNAQYIE